MEHVTEKVWTSCKGITSTAPDTTGFFIWEAPNPPKVHYFVCGVGGHCKMGQKVKITVAKTCLDMWASNKVDKKERHHKRTMKKRRKHKRTHKKQRT